MYQVLIVDDCKDQCIALQQILHNYGHNINVDICTDMISAQKISEKNKYDFFLLDVRMDPNNTSDDSGLQIALFIRSIPAYEFTPIIFITSVPEKIQEALSSTGCFRYILKPYSESDITTCLDSVLRSPLVPPSLFSFHSFWGGEIHIPEECILYICPGSHHRLQIYTQNGSYETTDYTMDQLRKLLHNNFYRCHRKYIVNINHITSYDRTRRSLLIGETTIALGRSYKEQFETIWRLIH